jgi:hypothetical protein
MSDHEPVQNLWQNQPQEDFNMSIEDIRLKASKFQGTVSMRNARELIVGALLIILFASFAWMAQSPLGKAAELLSAAGVAFVMWQLLRQARAATIDEVCLVSDWAAFHRAQLVRQRDALRGVWLWYLAPLVPGGVLHWIAAGQADLAKGNLIAALATSAVGILVMVLVFGGILWLNLKAAKGLQAEIDKIDRVKQDNGSTTP